jgi:hypothetical protein
MRQLTMAKWRCGRERPIDDGGAMSALHPENDWIAA